MDVVETSIGEFNSKYEWDKLDKKYGEANVRTLFNISNGESP